MLDRTNAAGPLAAQGQRRVANGFSPELLLYHAGDRTQVGGNLTVGDRPADHRLCGMGGRSRRQHDRRRVAAMDAKPAPCRGTRPRSSPSIRRRTSRTSLSLGFSYTPVDTKLTLNLEYHYSAGRHSRRRTGRNWFNAAAQYHYNAAVDAELWYFRSYAQDQEEPETRHSAFLRADWMDAFVTDLELTALANINVQDGSALVQGDGRLLSVARLDGGRTGQLHLRRAALRIRQPAASRRNSGAPGTVPVELVVAARVIAARVVAVHVIAARVIAALVIARNEATKQSPARSARPSERVSREIASSLRSSQ